jgi:hypothetical protein
MGGKRETMVESGGGSTSTPTKIGNIRVHDSGGQTHFHDDARGLKAAVSNAVWYEAWTDLSLPTVSGDKTWAKVDHVNKSCIFVKTEVQVHPDKVVVSSYAWILPAEVNDTFASLDNYTRPVKGGS